MLRILLLMGMFFVCSILPAKASLIISEFLADPPSGIAGDANSDGVGSTSQDEFVELFNVSSNDVDLDGWTLSDKTKVRHTFTPLVLPPSEFVVVFGGGTPSDVDSIVSSLGSLGLNNSGDTITLKDQNGNVIDQVTYASEGGKNQSLARLTNEPSSLFVLHTELNDSAFSPGTSHIEIPDETVLPPTDDPLLPRDPMDEIAGTSAVPELPMYVYLLIGCSALIYRKKQMVKFSEVAD